VIRFIKDGRGRVHCLDSRIPRSLVGAATGAARDGEAPGGEQLWHQIQQALQANLSKPTFETWIRPARCQGFDGQLLSWRPPTALPAAGCARTTWARSRPWPPRSPAGAGAGADPGQPAGDDGPRGRGAGRGRSPRPSRRQRPAAAGSAATGAVAAVPPQEPPAGCSRPQPPLRVQPLRGGPQQPHGPRGGPGGGRGPRPGVQPPVHLRRRGPGQDPPDAGDRPLPPGDQSPTPRCSM
jgi:hypothetical protein